jgi:hypothetical protein
MLTFGGKKITQAHFLLETRLIVQAGLSRPQSTKAGKSSLPGLEYKWKVGLDKAVRLSILKGKKRVWM